jgi:hypothetical protein
VLSDHDLAASQSTARSHSRLVPTLEGKSEWYMCAFWSMYEDLGGDVMSWWRSFGFEGSLDGSPEGMFAGFMSSSVIKLGLCMELYRLFCNMHYVHIGMSM